LRLTSPDDVDAEFTAWLAEAYQVGTQQARATPLFSAAVRDNVR
jgi:hypothetical protein